MDDLVRRDHVDDESAKMYRDFGYAVLPGLISRESVAVLKDEVMGIMDTIGLGMTSLKQTREYLAGGAIEQLVNSPNLAQIAGAFMNGAARLYLPFTAVKSPGGGGAFHFHQDNQYTRFDGPGINLWFALAPMSVENGCLYMVPHSHFLGTLTSVKDRDGKVHESGIEPEVRVPVPMQPGDCVAFSRLTVHGSGPNSTSEPRVAYAVQYARADIRYTRDFGESWQSMQEDGPGWSNAPVDTLTVPKGKTDGH